MIIKDLIKNNLALFLFLTASTAHAGIDDFIDSLSTKVQNKLSENGIKPYVIELEQGRLIDDKKLNQLATGLSKEQIEYLLGKPAKNPFNDNQWDYYYSNNIEEDEIKSLSVYFKNEKVFKITINNKIYKVLGQIKQSDVDLSLAPMAQVTNSQEDVSKESIIKITLEDVLNDGEELGLCKLNLYETFKDVKTLALADESTLEIRADNQSQDGTIFTAEGNAEAERQNDMLKADKITYDTSSKKVSALGDVKYFSDEISIYSKSAEYEGNKSDIGFSQAKYYRASGIGSGVSDKITFKSNKDVFLKNATYTSCNIDDPDWQLTSTSTTLYNSTERGHSYNMMLKYKNIPIFYTPFISYPLTDKRQSGILTPSFGSAGDSGTSLSVPYYFNLAENYDATVEVTSMSDRGVMFDNELRYLGFNESTLLNFTHLESDDEFGDDRYLYMINDNRILYDNMSVGNNPRRFILRSDINYSRVSDLDYFDDFGNSLSTASQSNVKREIRLFGTSSSNEYTLDYDLSTLSYQPTQSGVNEQYQTVPSLKLNYKNKSTSTLNYNLRASIDKFEHKDNTKAEGARYLIYPSIQMPIVTDGWELTSKLGIRHVEYDLDNNVSEGKSKTTPIASIRGKLYFDKYVGGKLHTLEPEAYLLYIPVGNQDNNPIFDTGLKEFKYSLFSENKFYGEDRLNDAKQISLGLTHRVIDETTGDELFSGTIGQIIYFDDRDVHLTNNTKSHSDASNIIGLASTKLTKYSTLSVGSVYNPHKGHGMRNNIRYRYDASSGSRNKIFNTDYRFIRGSEEEIDLSGVYSFNKEFSLVGKYNYSFSNNRSNTEDLIDTMIGIEFDSCCYSLKVVARDYWTGVKKDNVLYFEFLPKGLTTTNNKTSALLRRGIPGYMDRTDYE